MVHGIDGDRCHNLPGNSRGEDLPQGIVSSFPLWLYRLFERPSGNLYEQPVDTSEFRSVFALPSYGLFMIGRDKRPNFMTKPMCMRHPVPANGVLRAPVRCAR